MNILVIGNGFDLAHGLPTKYGHFLEFCEKVELIYNSYKSYTLIGFENSFLNWFTKEEIEEEMEEKLKEELIEDFKNNRKGVNKKDLKSYKIYTCIHDNIWFEYFIDIYKSEIGKGKENWIDFESEIERIIKAINRDVQKRGLDFVIDKFLCDSIDPIYKKMVKKLINIRKTDNVSFGVVREELEHHLDRLIRALEIYLSDYVQKMDCKLVSPDIQRILLEKTARINGIQIHDTYVLSFNYTNTYQRLYIDEEVENSYFEIYIDYIHGKANIENTIESDNIVLGIDEYLSKKRRNKETEFIAFKKYYQRIYKGTGCKYKEWVDQIKEQWEQETEESKAEIRKCIREGDLGYFLIHNLYIFGHSLNVTDKDVLRDLILNDNVHTTIFYHSKEELGRKIANLVKVIGQDELIRRTGGSTRTIKFQPQQEMKKID